MRAQIFIQKTYEDTETRRIIFRFLLGALVFLFFLYMYFIGSITFNILASKSLEMSLRDMSNNISQTELRYIALSNSINSQMGKDIGFVDAKGTIFAHKGDARVVLR